MNTEKAHRSVLGEMALAVLVVLALVPGSASAAVSPNAFLGGGNALSRATSGQSQGLTHANPASNSLARLTFASTRGGRPQEVPPPQGGESNTGGTEAEGTNGLEGAGASNRNQGEGSGNNGGVTAGNGGSGGDPIGNSASSNGAGGGGNGGSAAAGGLVRAGTVVTNANALNMLNVNIVRISSR